VTPPRFQRGNGWATTVTLPRGTTAAEAVAKLSKLAGAFDTVDQLVTMTPSAESNRRVWVWVADRDPLTGMAPSSPLTKVKQVNVWNGIPFGDTIHGEPVRVAAVGTHWLVVGASGSGKSRSFSLLPTGYGLDPFTQMILLDPEGFGAWNAFRPVATVIQGSEVDDLRAMAQELERVVTVEFPRRQGVIDRIMSTEPKLLPNNEIDAKISRDKRHRLPAIFIGVEEAVVLYSCAYPYDPSDTSGKGRTIGQVAAEATGQIQRRGRKYAIGIGVASQKATTDLLPSAITFGATTRFMLACSTTFQADSVMPGWRDLGMTPLKLKPAKPNRPGSGNPGAGYLAGVGLLDPDEDWVLLRTHYMDGNEIALAMEGARELREKVWPELLPDWAPPAEVVEPAEAPLDPADPQHLRHVIATFRGGEDGLRSSLIVERLQADHPGLYGQLTERGMNAFLRPFGVWTVKVGAQGHKGLQLYSVENALRDAEAPGDDSGDDAEEPRR
jgi:S-DNA-T family DNA segregation ATPase FtsK/SpoIIIE